MTHRVTTLLVAALLTLSGCASLREGSALSARALGRQEPLGKGTVATYAEFDSKGAPTAIGVVWSGTALDGLPTGSDSHHCFPRTKDGALDVETKCENTFEHAIPLPDAVARRADVPFKWVLLNWNPTGHIPPGIYDVPHFDVHFEMAPIQDIFAIESGPCGPELVRCDQFRLGKRPLPSNYVHPDFRDVDAVVPAMGNHLIDLTGPEFHKQPFTRSWIVGVYDGKVIFYEKMVSRAFLLGPSNSCDPIKSPEAVAQSGFYPTVSCIRYDTSSGERTVSMEKFMFREASVPRPTPTAK